jgi:multisubunit Na+/H+ antiporter MnhC subunit
VSVSLVLVVVMAVLYACGVYLMLERSMTKVLLGFLLLGNATNLLLLIMAGPAGVAPIVGDDVSPEQMSDPLPQALILTAIVITFAVSAFLMALIYRSWRLAKQDTVVDDEADVAMREGGVIFDDDSAPHDSDTEFEVTS